MGRMRGEQLVFHLPFGMYRVRTSADRSVENRFVLPGVVNSVEICKAADGTSASSPRACSTWRAHVPAVGAAAFSMPLRTAATVTQLLDRLIDRHKAKQDHGEPADKHDFR